MSDARTPILLVGSVPLRDEQEVFSAVSGTLGDHIRAIPDGETGERTNWINWQKSDMDQAPMLEKRQHVERSEEHTSDLQSLMRTSYAGFCLKKKNNTQDEVRTTKQQTHVKTQTSMQTKQTNNQHLQI